MTGRPTLLDKQTSLHITTVSDWHVGVGRGVPGTLDAVVRRDGDGLPYLPGTTLTGVVRDACLTVARALDDGNVDGNWQSWHRYAFGDAADKDVGRTTRRLSPAAVAIGPGRLPGPLRRELRGSRDLVEAATAVRVSVAIDPERGRAKDRALRFTEVATGGLPLEAEVTIDLPDEDNARAALTALLALGCGWCTELGGDRRRGLGRVALRLGTDDDPHIAATWAAWLADNPDWEPPARQSTVATARRPEAARLASTSDSPRWTVLDLEITTEAAIRVPRQTLGNVVRGHDYLPGSLLLPWLSDRWGPGTVRSAIVAGQLVARNAVPEVAGARGVPAPLNLNRSRGLDDEAGKPLAVGEPPKGFRQVRDLWTSPSVVDEVVRLQQPALAQVSHNAVDRSRQRPTSDAGIYELEVIPAGRRLRGQVVLGPAIVAQLVSDHGQQWWERLDGAARFGARRRGEYGAVRVATTPTEQPPPPPPTSGPVTLRAVSDVLVRGPGLRYSAEPHDLETTLTRQLGAPVTVDEVTARTRRRDSWHAGWQLPRETMTGLAAGSVFRVTAADGHQVDPARWGRLLLCGVGDRTAEGFGEVRLDDSLVAGTEWWVEELLPEQAAEQADGELTSECLDALRRLTARANQRRLVDAVVASRSSAGYGKVRAQLGKLSRSQRGTWLALTATAAMSRSTRTVREHADAWLAVKSQKRAPQVAVARTIGALLSEHGDQSLTALLPAPDLDLSTDESQARALAVLVADIVDDLRRRVTEEEQS